MSGMDYTLAELELSGVVPVLDSSGIPDDPAHSFIADDGHWWTVTGPSFIPGYDEVVRDDGKKSCRRADQLRAAEL